MRQSANSVSKRNLYVVKKNKDRTTEIANKIGYDAFNYISNYVNFTDPKVFYLPDDIDVVSKIYFHKPFNSIIKLKRINEVQGTDLFIKSVNERLETGGLFIGCCETGRLKKKQILRNYIFPVNHIFFLLYFIYKRIFPKLPLTKRIYRLISKGKNIAMSKVELFGRLYYGGFEIISEKEIGSLNYFVVKKTKKPCNNPNPSFYPLIKLKRIGKHGKIIVVYKLRTMHPYSEYLQEYVYNKNQLDKGGKIKNDIRVSYFGTLMRKFWIDELPMIFNLLKGNVKLFGVRPISQQYYNLYTEELKQLRIKHKPGLIPPFYVDLPKNLVEIIDSEKKYLREYEKSPYLTDLKYLTLALFNIIIRGNLSK